MTTNNIKNTQTATTRSPKEEAQRPRGSLARALLRRGAPYLALVSLACGGGAYPEDYAAEEEGAPLTEATDSALSAREVCPEVMVTTVAKRVLDGEEEDTRTHVVSDFETRLVNNGRDLECRGSGDEFVAASTNLYLISEDLDGNPQRVNVIRHGILGPGQDIRAGNVHLKPGMAVLMYEHPRLFETRVAYRECLNNPVAHVSVDGQPSHQLTTTAHMSEEIQETADGGLLWKLTCDFTLSPSEVSVRIPTPDNVVGVRHGAPVDACEISPEEVKNMCDGIASTRCTPVPSGSGQLPSSEVIAACIERESSACQAQAQSSCPVLPIPDGPSDMGLVPDEPPPVEEPAECHGCATSGYCRRTFEVGQHEEAFCTTEMEGVDYGCCMARPRPF